MIARSYRTERVCATLLGLVALLVGVGAVVLHARHVNRPVLDPTALDWARDHLLWVRVGLLLLGLLLVVIGLRWVWRAVTPERHPDLTLERDVVVTSGALADAVRADAEAVEGVSSARVKVIGEPALRMKLTLRQGADVRVVWRELDGVLGRAREALGVSTLPTAVRLDLAARSRQRVR
ncbi:alkaline shock response membrane anchor protein AmaP [Saccharothrix obliqua]|uniref:alkaline shock response membrane anchor protein AmaP n=1 Tax=Saccharothrix obliqua TaxID=2861747 RepID=UPI001C5D1B0B|nr:alkaline shock response membrane anchor protein AmaP [Saccharothrix obliqua]MBW4717466.1 alkaline shock response membrane anchor protein AmaP [Saccharothrix obliqua]